MLRIHDLRAAYGNIEVLHGIDLEVSEGRIVALIGANGAGKTTTLRMLSGLLKPTAGSIEFENSSIHGWAPHRLVNLGIVHVPEGRGILGRMSVLENLEMGAFVRSDSIQDDLESVFQRFPRLAERRNQPAGTLSGGEQQMLAIGRALMARPRLLLLDEPSMGLAPMIVEEIFALIEEINREGTTVLLVEQNARQALRIADYGYVLETGNIALQGSAAELLDDDRVVDAYLGGRIAS